jgi:arylsulfatase A-like enzyme
MSNKVRKNVIFLIIDSLRFDRLGIGGHTPSPSPVIDELLSSNLYLTNAFSVGSPTEFAYPGITTSTLPLDKGGYANGICDREVTLAEVFLNAGYRTVRFADDHTPSPGGYNRGYEDCFYMFDLGRFFADIDDNIPYYKKLWKCGKKSTEEVVIVLENYLSVLFADISMYCRHMKKNIDERTIQPSLLLHDYGLTEVLDIVSNAEKQFRLDPKSYILDLLTNKGPHVFDQIWSVVNSRQRKTKKLCDQKELRGLLLSNLMFLIRSSLKGRVSQRAIKSCLHLLLGKRDLRIPSAAYLFNNLVNWIDSLSKDKPFFAWVHTSDIHEVNFTSFDVLDDDIVKNDIAAMRKLHADILRQKKDYYGNPLYDYTIRYTDLQIGRLIERLRRRGLLDNTLIVLTADHGHDGVGWPIRDNIHIARDFYDELYHIPIAFINEDIQPQRVEGLYSSLDIAPTLLNFLNIQIPSSFRGMVIEDQANSGREYVMMEHLGPGPCDFKSKPIKVCVRSNTHKLLYEMPPFGEPRIGYIKELYAILDDPLEQKNLAGQEIMSNNVQKLLFIAKKRVHEICEEVACWHGYH